MPRHDLRPARQTQAEGCAGCLAWGAMYARGLCLACYNFASRNKTTAPCAACRHTAPLREGFCRLCWHQARLDRELLAHDARAAVILRPYLPAVRHHQLFLADQRYVVAAPRSAPRRYGAKGRPIKAPPPVAGPPVITWIQAPLFDTVRDFTRVRRADLRTGPAPDNPWLAWALHLAHIRAEACGWEGEVHRGMQRTLVRLLADFAAGERIRHTQLRSVSRADITNTGHAIEILTRMGIFIDDYPPTFEVWLEAKTTVLAPAIGRDVGRWARQLHDGAPRTKQRSPDSVRTYIRILLPALQQWSEHADHLREITHQDVEEKIKTRLGKDRETLAAALRSLFRWAKRGGLIFRNPAYRLSVPKTEPPVWQPLTGTEVDRAVAAVSTPQTRLAVALAAVHAAPPRAIRQLTLDAVNLAGSRLTIAGVQRPLDELTRRLLIECLEHRAGRWPNTANPYVIVSQGSALNTNEVSAAYLNLALRNLAATLDRLRIDRQLDEALHNGADPLKLVEVFGIDDSTALRYAANARKIMPGKLDTPPTNPGNPNAATGY